MSLPNVSEGRNGNEMLQLQTNIDDMNPEFCPYVADRLLQAGAHDVFWIPILMKKGRPGFLLNVLTSVRCVAAIERIVFEETTTLGIRYTRTECKGLERRMEQVSTPWGVIRVKVGIYESRVVQFAPEFADCEAAARSSGVPLKTVYEAARCSYSLSGVCDPEPASEV